MDFNNETKVKDIALTNPAARQVLEDAGLDYCCGGGRSLQDACLHADVPVEDILRRLRENTENVSPEDANWTVSALHELTGHIRDRHHRYTREAIARIQPLLDKVQARHGKNHSEIAKIQTLFTEVARELIAHMQKEEQILFPYIEALEEARNAHRSLEVPFFQTVRNPIHMMMKEHDAAGELVKSIHQASSGYAAPADACTSYKALYQALREFEADLHQHVHLENNILFPRAVELESPVL